MLGAIKGLFRAKPKDESVAKAEAEAKPPKVKTPKVKPANQKLDSDAFFLDADSAKTFGDIDYMRSSKSVRRSYPKEKLGKDNASVKTLSSLAKSSPNLSNGSAPAASPSQPDQPKSDRRRADSSMDMFRNMARDLKKD